jgi:hypothetical protein
MLLSIILINQKFLKIKRRSKNLVEKDFDIKVILEEIVLPNGDKETRVSHGIDIKSGMAIALEKTTNPYSIGARFDKNKQEWII